MGQSYQDLIAWQKAMEFVMDIYRNTKNFPRDEVYGLAAQLRRTAVMIPAHIAEGQAPYSATEFHSYLGRARGALVEVETELILAQNLEYLSAEQGKKMLGKASELGKILNGLAGAIRPAA
jgi:four helix bundle protein